MIFALGTGRVTKTLIIIFVSNLELKHGLALSSPEVKSKFFPDPVLGTLFDKVEFKKIKVNILFEKLIVIFFKVKHILQL